MHVETRVRRLDRRRVRLVEGPDRIDRRSDLRPRVSGRLSEAPADHVNARERIAQSKEIDVAELIELGSQQALRVRIPGVAFEDIEVATVEVEIARAAPEPAVDLGVVALALLPSGGHQRDRPVDPECPDLCRQVDPVEWPEQGHLPHDARTRTVSPTTLSMWRRVS